MPRRRTRSIVPPKAGQTRHTSAQAIFSSSSTENTLLSKKSNTSCSKTRSKSITSKSRYHTYYVATGVLVHNACNSTKTATRADAIKEGKDFLGDGYSKLGPGRYLSADGHRVMRFDFTHHGGTAVHINLEFWKNPVAVGVRNKLLKNIHIFFE